MADGVVITPEPEWGAVSVSVTQGSSFTLTASGYQPGEYVNISYGVAQTDSFVLQDQLALVDAEGTYSFTITLPPDLEPGTYGVLTYVSDGNQPVPHFEETKRHATVEVLAR